jgi:hypothetical protein
MLARATATPIFAGSIPHTDRDHSRRNCASQPSNHGTMRIPSSLVPLTLLLSTLAACSSNDTDTPVNPQGTDTTKHTDTTHYADTTIYRDSVKVYRAYDSSKGGVQIMKIFFDQALNGDVFEWNDEWIVLQSNGITSTKDWYLNAGDPGQDYALPDTIYGQLTIYTHVAPDTTSRTSQSLRLSPTKWIWNNADPDVAYLYDANHTLVSTMSYPKK